MIIVCSHTQAFNAFRLRYAVEEIIVDHETADDYLYLFDPAKAPAGVDVEAIKLREAQA